MVWSRTYCCCAIPLYNAGVYAIIAQFVVVSLVAGILSMATPSIVAVSIPSFGPYILGVACILVALIQIMGFLGVYRERPAMFKTYARINAGLVAVAFIIALAFIILSAARHSTAMIACEALFSSQTMSNSTIGGQTTSLDTGSVTSGTEICNIWTWVQVGIMGLLFIIVGLCEGYFLMYENIYASEQKLDHARYDSVYSAEREEIRQSGLWDAASTGRPSADGRPSAEGLTGPQYSHGRQTSSLRNEISRDDNEKWTDTQQQHEYQEPPYAQERSGEGYRDYANNGAGSGYRDEAYEQPYYPSQAHNAYEQPTPIQTNYANASSYGGTSGLEYAYPEQARTQHPLEGMGGARKTPKPPVESNRGWDPAYHQ